MRLLALLLVFVAHAAPADDDREGKINLARRHFQSGGAWFEEGRYDEAAREFEASYRLTGHADLLYNIAQCFVRKGDAARAVQFFDDYLAKKRDATDRAGIGRIVAELRRHIGALRVEGAPDGSEVSV